MTETLVDVPTSVKTFVFPNDTTYLRTYGMTASSIFEPLYAELRQRSDWSQRKLNEKNSRLFAGNYEICERGSSRRILFKDIEEKEASGVKVKLEAGMSLRVQSRSGVPPFVLRIAEGTKIKKGKASRIQVEFLPIEAQEFRDQGRLDYIEGDTYDYCSDERLSKVASTILDTHHITNKTNLVTSMASEVGPNGFIPPSYQIQFGGWYGPKPATRDGEVWFLKNSVRDRASGIQLLKTPEEALRHVEPQHRYVLQPSLKTPALLDGRKYDLRFYVSLVHDEERLFWCLFRTGLLRKCAEPYVRGSLEPARQLSNFVPEAAELESFNRQKYGVFTPKSADYESVIKQVGEIVGKLAQSTRFLIGTRRKSRRFHFLSLDFGLQSDGRLWLFEVNNSPGLRFPHSNVHTELVEPLFRSFVDDALEPLIAGKSLGPTDNWSVIA
ncbi:MAG: hypothetical protein VYC39_06975 [Myxococcota bacterium]|nr:hypothetical protein [Myxococcota bacterium]